MSIEPWIGVDWDGTLVKYRKWQGPDVSGPPILAMVERIKNWLKEGRKVKIFTARAAPQPDNSHLVSIAHIQEYTKELFGVALEVTCIKDYGMQELWDDRAIGVEPNTGNIRQYYL